MALTQQRKQEIISGYQVHETDTGSADVQFAMLTDRIQSLTKHLQVNKKESFLSQRVIKDHRSEKASFSLYQRK